MQSKTYRGNSTHSSDQIGSYMIKKYIIIFYM